MDKTGQVNRVDFSAFCKAFESIEEKSGKSICSALDISSTVASTDFIYREADGDGDIRVPEYGFVKGKGQVVASRWLSQNGHVQRDAEGGSSFVARTDSELARYFIAGAFGIGELTDASGLDMTIVEGLRGLYGACLKDEKNCLDSPQARKVSSAWQAILDERERARVAKRALDAKKTEVAGLQQAYEKLVDKVVDRGQLAVGVAPYKSNMPVLPSTMEDFETAGRLLNGMIEVAKAVISSDEKRMEADRRRAELVHYRAENSSMRAKIKKAMGPYWRFTNAYDAGMKCMPMPRNSEEEYCVEKNKYEMGVWLEWAAREHPEGWRCLEYETKEVLFTKRDSGGATSKTECVRWEPKGRDTSEEEAVSKAMSYCSTTCQ